MKPGAFNTLGLDWQAAYRVIPSKFPPIPLFEDLATDPAQWDLLADLEAAVNPRVRDEIGEIHLVPPDQRVASTAVMAPFTHRNPLGSRFSDGSFGVYYAARHRRTAILETVHHLEQRLRAGHAAMDQLDQRVLVGRIKGMFVDLTSDPATATPLLDPDDYSLSRPFGAAVRDEGRDGIHYQSVRHPGHAAVAVFIPLRVSPPVQERHLQYRWNGERVDRYFDYRTEAWTAL